MLTATCHSNFLLSSKWESSMNFVTVSMPATLISFSTVLAIFTSGWQISVMTILSSSGTTWFPLTKPSSFFVPMLLFRFCLMAITEHLLRTGPNTSNKRNRNQPVSSTLGWRCSMFRLIQVHKRAKEISTMTTEKYVLIIGVVSDVGGVASTTTIINTVIPRRTVVVSEILSPVSGGNKKAVAVRSAKTMQGKTKLLI